MVDADNQTQISSCRPLCRSLNKRGRVCGCAYGPKVCAEVYTPKAEVKMCLWS
jgi:hypothetical protein